MAALPPLATLTDLEGWLGSPLGSDGPRAEAVLDAVSSMIRSEAGRTWEGEVVPDDVATVTLTAAARVFRNPDGYSSERVGSYSYQFSGGADGLSLTREERAIVARYRTSPRGLWSQPFTRGDGASTTVFVPVVDAPPFPWYDE